MDHGILRIRVSILIGLASSIVFELDLITISSDGHNISRVGNEDDGYQNTTLNINSAFQINSELSVSAVARKSTGMVEYDSDDDFDGLVEDQEKALRF